MIDNKNFLITNQCNFFISNLLIQRNYEKLSSSITIKHFDARENIIDYPKRGLLTTPEIEFEYIINEFGFRSEQFKKLNKENYNILYAGCSFTFGTGLPENLTWHNMLTEKIKDKIKNKEVKYYNVGSGGLDIISIVKNVYTFINLYGIPDQIFILVPEVTRAQIYDGNKYVQFTYKKNILFSENKRTEKVYMKNLIYENAFFNCSSILYGLESFCNNLNIQMLWTSWNSNDFKFFNKLNFKNYINIETPLTTYTNDPRNGPNYHHDLPINKNQLPYWEHARDLEHPGTCFSENVSKLYYDKWINNV